MSENYLVCEKCKELRKMDRVSLINNEWVCDWCAVGKLQKDIDMKKVFDKYRNQEDWKKPSSVLVSTIEDARKVKEAFEFFHGTKAIIRLNYTHFEVSTPGYGC